MSYYNPYFEDRKMPESCLNYTYEQFEDMKPKSYFLAMLRHNYQWTKDENLDTFSFRISPSFVFWHDRLVDYYWVEELREIFMEMLDVAGLLDEPLMLMVQWSRDILPEKVKNQKVLIDSEDEPLIIDLKENEQIKEIVWQTRYLTDDIATFSLRYDIQDKLYVTREKSLVLRQNPKEANRNLAFLMMNPKAE